MNQVLLIGRLTKDPEVRYSGETPIARFSIAIDRPPKKDGSKQADFPNVVCFGKTAELVERYLAKGRQVAIEGRLQTGSYEKQDGTKVYTTDVMANRVEFLGGKDENKGNERSEQQREELYSPEGFERVDESDLPF